MTQRKSVRHPASAQELREAFAAADRDRDGRIGFAEFRQLLDDLESGMSQQDLSMIDAREFFEWWRSD